MIIVSTIYILHEMNYNSPSQWHDGLHVHFLSFYINRNGNKSFSCGFQKLHRVHINDEKTYAYTSIFFINQP